MTVAIGLVCGDAVLVAADSKATDVATAHNEPKVHVLEGCPVIWTGAGSKYVMEEVGFELDEFTKRHAHAAEPPSCLCIPDPRVFRERLKEAIHPPMQRCYEGALCATPREPGTIPKDLETQFLVLDRLGGVPRFLEFAEAGDVESHADLGFYGVGIGGPHAMVALALMEHHFGTPLSLRQGLMVAYRTIETVCNVATGGVGLPVQIAIATGDGARILTTDEIVQIGTGVDRWKQLELETLRMGDAEAEKGALRDLPIMDVQT